MFAEMSRGLQTTLWIVVAAQVALAAGYVFEISAAVDLWPFAERGQLTNIFIGSIFAAAAASTAWCLVLRSMRALAGIALDYVVILGPLGGYSFVRAVQGEGSRAHLVVFGLVSLVSAGVGVALLRSSLRVPWRDPRPVPQLVRWSFVAFLVALAIVASLLIVRVEVLPWPVTGELSTLIGFMFLGAAAYFVYGIVVPRWENAGGQLAGFLAYDLVLIWPFLERLPTIGDDSRLSLIVYTTVVVYSGGLAVYFLLLHPGTRGRWSVAADAQRAAPEENAPAAVG